MCPPQTLLAVLDDEPDMRVALRRLLTPRGYEVAEFESGPELLAACSTRPIRCIILDLHMPGMDGFEILQQLSLNRCEIPVIVITGHDQAGNADRVARLGARAYLTKPVDGVPLLATLAALVATSALG